MKQENKISIVEKDFSFDNYFCEYLDDCGKGKINEKCFRAYYDCKTYQENKCYEQREKEKKQQNLEKMIVSLKKRIN